MFGVSPLGCQFVAEKTPNKLGTPTGDAFLNRIFERKRVSSYQSLFRRFLTDILTVLSLEVVCNASVDFATGHFS